MPIKTAVIGMGPIGNRHAAIYRKNPKIKLVGLCEKDASRNQAAASQFNLPCYSSIEALFAKEGIDLCSVTTGGYEYGSDHFEPTMFALENGAHAVSYTHLTLPTILLV